jgi:hypothetical protein
MVSCVMRVMIFGGLLLRFCDLYVGGKFVILKLEGEETKSRAKRLARSVTVSHDSKQNHARKGWLGRSQSLMTRNKITREKVG